MNHNEEDVIEFVPKVFLNEYGFRVVEVKVLANGNIPIWNCNDESLISKSSKKEVEMTVNKYHISCRSSYSIIVCLLVSSN